MGLYSLSLLIGVAVGVTLAMKAARLEMLDALCWLSDFLFYFVLLFFRSTANIHYVPKLRPKG